MQEQPLPAPPAPPPSLFNDDLTEANNVSGKWGNNMHYAPPSSNESKSTSSSFPKQNQYEVPHHHLGGSVVSSGYGGYPPYSYHQPAYRD